MERLSDLQALGLTLPSPAYIFGAILFGIAGIAAYRYGKRMGRQRTRWLGVALMLYPYVISNTWLMYGVGALLGAGVYVDGRGGDS